MNSTKHSQYQTKQPNSITTTIHMKLQWPNYSVKSFRSSDLLSKISNSTPKWSASSRRAAATFSVDTEHCYDHVPKSVQTSHKVKVTILWNQEERNDRTIPNNKQDIIIRDNKIGTFMLIYVPIPGDRNVIRKDAEKILKCKNLIIEIQRTSNVKAKVLLVIIDTRTTYQESTKLR
jgi:hypothetical protein